MEYTGSDFLNSLNLMSTHNDVAAEISIYTDNIPSEEGQQFIYDISGIDLGSIQASDNHEPIEELIHNAQVMPVCPSYSQIENDVVILGSELSSFAEDSLKLTSNALATTDAFLYSGNESSGSSDEEPESHYCTVCMIKFSRKENLVKHLITPRHQRSINNDNQIKAAHLYTKHHNALIKHSAYYCGCCRFSSASFYGLIMHIKSQQHNESVARLMGPLECVHCNFLDYDGTSMLNHFMSPGHRAKSKKTCYLKECRSNIKCKLCLRVLHSAVHYSRHMRAQHTKINDDENLRDCRYCDYRGKPSAVTQHIIRSHQNIRTFSCSTCLVGFHSASDLKKHYNTGKHLENLLDSFVPQLKISSDITDSHTVAAEGKTMKCKFCPFITHSINCLQSHYVTQHDVSYPVIEDSSPSTKSQKLAVCRFCSRTIDVKELVEHEVMHVLTHRSEFETEAEKPGHIKCFICRSNIEFSSHKSHILEHCNKKVLRKRSYPHNPGTVRNTTKGKALKDTVEARFFCSWQDCTRSYKTQGDLNIHLRSHEDKDKFPCKNCSKGFPTRKQLKAHMLSHQPTELYNCDYCEYRSKTKCHLERHMRIHAGSKPYSCPYCQYTSTTIGNLRKHIMNTKKHAGQSMYECSETDCRFTCSTSRAMAEHLILVHNKSVNKIMVKSTENDWTEIFEGHPIIPVQH